MKKLLTITLLLFLLTACKTNINPQIPAPQISKDLAYITWDDIADVKEFEILIQDITTKDDSLLLDDQVLTLSENSFDYTTLQQNKIFEVKVRSIIGDEFSRYSNTIILDLFTSSQSSYSRKFNLNSTDDFILYGFDTPVIYFIKQNDSIISENSFSIKHDFLFIDNDYLQNLEGNTALYLYTDQGIIKLTINPENITKPFLRTTNSLVFEENKDISFVFELCGGTLIELNGNGISEQHYTLFNNLLIIDYSFFEDLFNANSERNSVILSYQLISGQEVVIGYLFINRNWNNVYPKNNQVILIVFLFIELD